MLRVTTDGPITRIQLLPTLVGRPLHQCSAYLLGGLLIDSGPPATAHELMGWLRDSGAAERIEALVLTHHHEDHVGGAPLVVRELGVPVWAPAATAERIAAPRSIPLYRAVVWGRPRQGITARPLGEELAAGGWRFQVHPTPGHAFDHVCLWQPERRWLVSGDLYVHPRVRYLRRIEKPWVHLASLERMLALAPRRLLCAHAGVVDDGEAALAAKGEWWRRLATEARVLSENGLSPRRITRRLLGREGLFTYFSFGDFSKINLIRALLVSPPESRSSPDLLR